MSFRIFDHCDWDEEIHGDIRTTIPFDADVDACLPLVLSPTFPTRRQLKAFMEVKRSEDQKLADPYASRSYFVALAVVRSRESENLQSYL